MKSAESRQEVLTVLKPKAMAVMKAASGLKKAIQQNADEDELDEDKEEDQDGDDTTPIGAEGMMMQISQASGLSVLQEKLKAKLRLLVEERGLPWAAVERLIDELDTKEELENALEDPDAFLKNAALGFAIDVVVHKLKGKLKPLCIAKGLPWLVVEKAIDTLDSAEELQAALEDFEGWMENAFETALPTLIEILAERLRPMVEAKGLPWAIVQEPLENLNTLQEVMDTFADLDGFLESIFSACGDMLLSVLKEKLLAYCHKMGLQYALVESALEDLDDTSKLREAIFDIEAFLAKLFESSFEAFMTLLKGKLKAFCLQRGLPFDPFETAVDAIDNVEEVRNAVLDPEGFMTNVLAASMDGLIEFLKSKLKPYCESKGLVWALVEPVVDELDSVQEIQSAIADVDGFLAKVFAASAAGLVQLAKGKMKPYCLTRGWPWEVVEPAIDELDSAEKLQSAISDVEGFLADVLSASIAALITLAKDKLKPICEKKGLPFTLVEPAIDALDTAEKLQEALADVEGFLADVLKDAVDALLVILTGKLKPIIEKKGLPFDVIEPAIKALDTTEKLQNALADIEGFLAEVLTASFDALIVLLKDHLKPVCEEKGVAWPQVEHAINALDTAEKVQVALMDPKTFLAQVAN